MGGAVLAWSWGLFLFAWVAVLPLAVVALAWVRVRRRPSTTAPLWVPPTPVTGAPPDGWNRPTEPPIPVDWFDTYHDIRTLKEVDGDAAA